MSPTRLFLLLAIGAIGSGQALAAPLALRGCNLDQIRADLQASKVPNLIGCKPETVDPILGTYDYGLTIESRVASRSIRAGRIVSQRENDSHFYVDVSTGPESRQQSSEGQRTDDTSQPSEQRHDRTGEAIGQILGGLFTAIANAPRQRPPPPPPPPYQEQPPAANERLAEVLKQPSPAKPPTLPSYVQPPPPPPPALSEVAPAQTSVARPSEPSTDQPQPPPVADTAPAPTTVAPPVTDAEVPPPPEPPKERYVPPVPPPVFRISIPGGSSLNEGDDFLLIVRRDRRDDTVHRLGLHVSNPALLDSPPPPVVFGPGSADKVILRLRTAVAEGTSNHNLVVGLVSDGTADVGEPVTAVILDRTPWWQKLLEDVASLPGWIAALAAAAAAASAAPFLMPRATCSIGGGSVDLGPKPLRSSWPAMSVETVIGDASFSIPSPLPIGRRIYAEPTTA